VVSTVTELSAGFTAFTQLIAEKASADPTKTAVIDGHQSYTYAQLDRWADGIARALQNDGIGPGKAAAICGAPSASYLAALIGVLRAGAAAVLLSPSATSEQLAAMMVDSGSSHVFVDEAGQAAMAATLRPLEVRWVGLDETVPCAQSLDSWIETADRPFASVAIDPMSPFNVIYSSGTTGTPKGIVHSHQMRAALCEAAGLIRFHGDAVTLVSTPLYSNTTLTALLPTLAVGGTLVLMSKFDPGRFLALVESRRVTHAMLVPVQYRRILDHLDFDRTDLSSFEVKYATSAPFSAEMKAEVLRRWPGGLIEFYGLTEGGGSTMLIANEHPDKLDTVGRPAPGHDIKLVDADGREAPSGAVGEIVGRSDDSMTKYLNKPDATSASRWISPEGNSYFRTGDLGVFDEDGFLRIVDRAKDMIISGGFNVYPSDLEQVIASHPDVAEVAVVGVPSSKWGETPVAFVTPRSGRDIGRAGLFEWANAQLGKTQRLSDLVMIGSLQRSAIGKVLKRELRDTYMREKIT
jgi:long-chain acyl-CoA synthetase